MHTYINKKQIQTNKQQEQINRSMKKDVHKYNVKERKKERETEKGEKGSRIE